MRWFCLPSKKLASEPLALAPVVSAEPTVSAEPVVSEVAVKKCSSCKDARCCVPCVSVHCSSVKCVPVKCVPLRCWKSSQPLVLRSTPPAENEKLTSVVGVSAPDATLVKAPATEAVSQVSQ